MKSYVVAGVVAVIASIAVAYSVVQRSPSDSLLVATGQSGSAGAILTPQYLFEHPDTLKEAEQKCRENDDPSSLYCSNVHRAESLRMADQYRRSLTPKDAGK